MYNESDRLNESALNGYRQMLHKYNELLIIIPDLEPASIKNFYNILEMTIDMISNDTKDLRSCEKKEFKQMEEALKSTAKKMKAAASKKGVTLEDSL